MNRPLLLALAAVSLTHAEAALAGKSCGGGGGGGSGGSSGGSSGGGSWGGSDSSSDGGDSSSTTPACVDGTDIVGHRRCTPFGLWSTSPIGVVILELGTAVRTSASSLGEATGHVSHDSESFAYRATGTPVGMTSPPPETAVLTTLRLGFAPARNLYLAGELELGGLARTPNRVEMMSTGTFGAPSITPTSTLVVGGTAVAGLRGDLRGLTLGAEVAGGARVTSYLYESHYLSCVTTTSIQTTSSILEARARASLWLSPFINVGASVGASVIDRGGWMAGLHLGFASRAFGDLRD
jgi:hypothetical protein